MYPHGSDPHPQEPGPYPHAQPPHAHWPPPYPPMPGYGSRPRSRGPGLIWIAGTWALFVVSTVIFVAAGRHWSLQTGLLAFICFVAAGTTTILGFTNGSVSVHPMPPPDTPYHLLGLLGDGARHRFLRPTAEIVLLVASFIVFGFIVVLALGPFPETESGPLGQVIPSVCLLPAAVVAVRLAGRRPGTLSSVAGSVRWRWLGACALRALAVAVVERVVRVLFGGDVWRPEDWPGAATWWPAAGAAVVAYPLYVAALLYSHGLILQAVGAWTARRWPAIVLTAAAFTVWSWPDHPLEVVAHAVYGLSLWWLTIRTGGLEAALGLSVVEILGLELFRLSQGIDGPGPTPDGPLLDVLPGFLVYVLAVLAYTWWTARTAGGVGRKDPA